MDREVWEEMFEYHKDRFAFWKKALRTGSGQDAMELYRDNVEKHSRFLVFLEDLRDAD
jgi:hypothetical protein